MSDAQAAPLRAEDVLRDLGYPGFVTSLYNRTGNKSRDWTHAVLGVVTEIRELITAPDAIEGLGEQGDLRFYGQAAINLTEEFSGLEFDYESTDAVYAGMIERSGVIGSEEMISDEVKRALDVCKRWVGFDKEPADIMLECVRLIALVQFVSAHARFGEPDADKVELANVAKLLHRYKGLKFSVESSANKDVASERRVLQAAS